MHVIDGGIPIRPENAYGPGDVYLEIIKAHWADINRKQETNAQFYEKWLPVEAYLNHYHQTYQTKYDQHVQLTGNVHGDTVESIGLPLINDYPNATPKEVLIGESWTTYVTPKVLNDTIQLWKYKHHPNIIDQGLLSVSYQRTLPYPTEPLTGNTEPVKKVPITNAKACYYKNKAIILGNEINPVALVTDPLNLRFNDQLSCLGNLKGELGSEGWSSGTLYRDVGEQRQFKLLNGLQFDDWLSPNTSFNKESSKGMWVLPYFKPNLYLVCYLYSDHQGVHFSFSLQYVAEGTEPTEVGTTLTLDERIVPHKTTVMWSDLGLPGMQVTYRTPGGINWVHPGKLAFMGLLFNGVINGEAVTVSLGWEMDCSEYGQLRVKSLFNKDTLLVTKDRFIPKLPTHHAFHPIHGAGVFKPDGGHLSGVTQHGALGVREHHHPIKSLKELYDRFKEIPKLPIRTLLNVRSSFKLGVMGVNTQRLFLVSGHHYLIGTNYPNGNSHYYLASVEESPTLPLRLDNIKTLGTGAFIRNELVNGIDGNEPFLHGLWWSNLNQYEGKQEYRAGYRKAGGKSVSLGVSTVNWLQDQLKKHSNPNPNHYLGIVKFTVDHPNGLAIISDRQGSTGLINVTLVEEAGVVNVEHFGEYVELKTGVTFITHGSDNLGQFDHLDLYVHNHGITFRGLDRYVNSVLQLDVKFDIELGTDEINPINNTPNAVRLFNYHPPIPTDAGELFTYRLPEGTEDEVIYQSTNGLTLKPYEVSELTEGDDTYILFINPDLQILLSGVHYMVPPGLNVVIPKRPEPIYVTLVSRYATLHVELRDEPEYSSGEVGYVEVTNGVITDRFIY